jgi:hypothetical protein
MRIDEGFRAAYRELETRMKALAEADGDVQFADYRAVGTGGVRLCPHGTVARQVGSLRRRGEVEGRSRIPNFISSIEDFILHFCIQQYLCAPTQRYHITDLSKGAMLVKRAGVATQRYDTWYGLLGVLSASVRELT